MKLFPYWYRVVALTLLLVLQAFGHDVGLSTATIEVRNGKVEAVLTFSAKDVEQLVQLDRNSDGHVTPGEFAAEQANISRVLTNGCHIRCGDSRINAISFDCQLDQTNNVVIQLSFRQPSSNNFEISFPVIRDLAAGHRMFVTQLGPDHKSIGERLISRESPEFQINTRTSNAAPAQETSRSFASFLWLGVEHIGTGYDHLLFLFGLLLVARNLKSSLAVITSFTLAHSITLAASTLNLITLRPSITEPAIAASIVYVGVENLLRSGESRGRWLLTFAFGLIHGFGFASVLRDMGVGASGSVVMPLCSFNLGVELGQMTIAAIMLPIIWKLRTSEAFTRRLVPACCVAIAVAGTCWFCGRVWGS